MEEGNRHPRRRPSYWAERTVRTTRDQAPSPVRKVLLRHLKVVKAGWMVGIVRVAEIERTDGQLAGDNRLPNTFDQIGAGFDHDPFVACA